MFILNEKTKFVSKIRNVMRYILATIIMTLISVIPTWASQVNSSDAPITAFETSAHENVSVEICGSRLRIRNASGQTLEIYSITGTRVLSYRIDHNDQMINLDLGKGCYIVKVGSVARKISINK